MLLVLDTNVVLDLLVFKDPATVALREHLDSGGGRCIATAETREELLRVLDYPHIVAKLAQFGLQRDGVVAAFDRMAQLYEPAPRAAFACRDADDQKFIDLAAQHGATLLSKDLEVLTMTRRLATLGVTVARQWQGPQAVSPA